MFSFRLQRILELREKAEQARAQELAAAQDSADVARRQRDGLADIQTQSRETLAETHRNGPRIGHLQQLGFALQSLDVRVTAADDAVQDADHAVADARRQLEDAARDRRVLGRLKERHADQWRTEEAHKDRLGMDEIALARFSRKSDAATAEDAASPSRTDARKRVTKSPDDSRS